MCYPYFLLALFTPVCDKAGNREKAEPLIAFVRISGGHRPAFGPAAQSRKHSKTNLAGYNARPEPPAPPQTTMKTTTIARCGSALLAIAVLPAHAFTNAEQAPASPAAHNEKLPRLIREAEKGVFFLKVLDADQRVISTGTGFLVEAKGEVITSLHVVRPINSPKPPATVEAIDASGKTFKVNGVMGADESLDLALLQLGEAPTAAVPVALAGDEPPERGAYVLVVGHPQGLRFVATDGIVSAVSKTRELPQMFREGGCVLAGPEVVWLQTSASVSIGNSGGPMLDGDGKAIGVMQWMARGAGMNFALHISAVRGFLAKPRTEAINVAEFVRQDYALLQIQRDLRTDFGVYFDALRPGRGRSGSPSADASAPVAEHPARKHLPPLLELAMANRGRSVELRALSSIMLLAGERCCPTELGPEIKRAADLLLAEYRDDRRILQLLRCRSAPTLPEARDFLRALAEKSTDAEIRALAAFSLALALEADGAPVREEALKFALAAVTVESEILLGSSSLKEMAKNLVVKLSHSVAGCPAPGLNLKGPDGKEVKLTDFRGRHVLLVFWNNDFFDHIPQSLDEIARAYAGSPLEILGIKLYPPALSRSSHVGLTKPNGWQVFSEELGGSLAGEWHITESPTVLLVDPAGMIRCRFVDRPSTWMTITGDALSVLSTSSPGANAQSWKTELTKELDAIPAIFESKDKLKRLLTSGPWLALNDWQGKGERTVFLRENGKSSVKWITKWVPRPPAGLHVDVTGVGCVDLEVDLKTGEAKVISPPAFAQRKLKLRDSGLPTVVESGQMAKGRECLLKEAWQWFASGGIGTEKPYMKFRFIPDGTTTSELLTAWEMLPSGQVQLYLYDGRSWAFDLDLAAKSARSNIKDSQLKENKAFAASGGETPPKD